MTILLFRDLLQSFQVVLFSLVFVVTLDLLYISLATSTVSKGILISFRKSILYGLNPDLSVLGADLMLIRTVGKRRSQLLWSLLTYIRRVCAMVAFWCSTEPFANGL